MFYVNKQKKFKPIPPSQIYNVLIIPSKQRQVKDHQLVYRYFIDNFYLNQIERTKSVNARMKCVASIQILSKNQFKQDKYQYLAVLSIKKVKQFVLFDERQIRQKMQNLSKFKLFSLMKYNQLLFLAQMYEVQQFKYSQFLYKQNDNIQNFYLVQKGQFHYVKFYEQDISPEKYKIDMKKILQKKKKSQKSSFPFFNEQSINKNRSKQKKIKEYRVGFIQGDAGQCIGQEQIILLKSKRQYGAKCYTTNNRVLTFKKSTLEVIMSQNKEIHQKLKKQIFQKFSLKNQLINHIKQTKGNINNVIKLIQIQRQKQKQKVKEQNLLQIENGLNNMKLPSLRHKHISSELPDINRKFSSMSRVKDKSLFITQDLHHKHSHNQNKEFFKNEQHDQENLTFALTQFKKTKTNEIAEENYPKQRATLIQDASFDDSIKVKPSKSWNINLTNSQHKKKLNFKQKYIGMIDSSTLVKEKQYIISIKSDKKDHDMGRQFQIKQRALWRVMQKQKQKAKNKSPAHSKQFMQKMLLSALRKAGYNQASPMIETQASGGITERQLSQSLQKSIQIKQQIKLKQRQKQKKTKEGKKQIDPNSQVLEKNPFDQCYFGKIE